MTLLHKIETRDGFNIIIDGRFSATFPKECEPQIDYLIERANDVVMLRERVRNLPPLNPDHDGTWS